VGGLLAFLDATRSSAGRRRLRQWLLRPLRQIAGIHRRLDAVEALVSNRCVCVCVGGGLLLLRTPREWGVGGVSMRTFVLVMRAPDSQWGVATPRQAGAGAAAGGAECGRVRLRRLVTVLRRLLTVLRCVLTVLRCVLTVLRCVLTVLRCDVERELSALARVGAQARTG
jgi:hypothetical protein